MPCRASSTVTQHKTAEVRVVASPRFMPDLHTNDGDFIFAYDITICNEGEDSVRLLSRRWVITDGDNKVRRVAGEGVVGEQPQISPGEEYSYTSYVDLPTPVGCMSGAYVMERQGGERFEADIGVFSMSAPHSLN